MPHITIAISRETRDIDPTPDGWRQIEAAGPVTVHTTVTL